MSGAVPSPDTPEPASELASQRSATVPAATLLSDKSRFAIKTALSLTLAYLLPMAMGWPQPQTAATTVMLIAATGVLSESLQKGLLRILGTVAGAVIGLSLIALFPQDRLSYLIAVSVVVAIILYLYNAYQGDSTLFMLTAVVTLMVFNGGDAEGAFLYGIDRAFMTVFGVAIYTLVGSLLWPVKVANNIESLAEAVSDASQQAFDHLAAQASASIQQQASGHDLEQDLEQNPEPNVTADQALVAALQAFQLHYRSVSQDADRVQAYQAEWNTIGYSFEQLETILVSALQSKPCSDDLTLIPNYEGYLAQIHGLFEQLSRSWNGQPMKQAPAAMTIDYDTAGLQQQPQLSIAAVVGHVELLTELRAVLLQLVPAVDSLVSDYVCHELGRFEATPAPLGKPAFIWFDWENVKTALRGFTTFWIATAIWLQFNPPGGFMFVTLCTIFIPLLSFKPVAPKLLFILFTLAFLFALPAYVFLLPQMTHWLELAAFLFVYAFVGFYVFKGPVSIFFLLGLFTLGIQNTMNYHVDAILLTMLMFYMVCSVLVIAMAFPFTSKPQLLYLSFRRRVFRHCAQVIRRTPAHSKLDRILCNIHLVVAGELVAKLRLWGGMIDSHYYPANSPQHITAFNEACASLLATLHLLSDQRRDFASNALIAKLHDSRNTKLFAHLCDVLVSAQSEDEIGTEFGRVQDKLTGIDEALRQALPIDYINQVLSDSQDQHGDKLAGNDGRKVLAEFYVYLNLQHAIFAGIVQCRETQQALDWQQLQEAKF